MAKKPAKKKPATFQNGWRVLVHLPSRTEVAEGIVGETVRRKKVSKRVPWVWVNVEGHWQLVREIYLEHKTDEPYCADFVKELRQASLVRDESGRELIVTPTSEKGYLKSLNGPGWGFKGAPVMSKLKAKVLDEVYKRLVTEKAEAASAGL